MSEGTKKTNGMTRRDFVKGLAVGAAGIGVATILPGGIIAAAAVANFLQWGIAAVNAMVVSAIFFFIGELTGANK